MEPNDETEVRGVTRGIFKSILDDYDELIFRYEYKGLVASAIRERKARLSSLLYNHDKAQALLDAEPAEQAQLTFAKFSEVNRKRCESPDGFGHALDSWSTSDWMTATCGELGEAANVVKKLNRYRDGVKGNKQSESELRKQLGSELADTFIYLDLLAQREGMKIGQLVADTFNAKSKEIGSSITVLDAEPAGPRRSGRRENERHERTTSSMRISH